MAETTFFHFFLFLLTLNIFNSWYIVLKALQVLYVITSVSILHENFNYFHTDSNKDEMNGAIPLTRLSHSVPGSPIEDELNTAGVIGSAESLVGRVFIYI